MTTYQITKHMCQCSCQYTALRLDIDKGNKKAKHHCARNEHNRKKILEDIEIHCHNEDKESNKFGSVDYYGEF